LLTRDQDAGQRTHYTRSISSGNWPQAASAPFYQLDSYILDTDTNLLVMQIDHFTDVALVARGDTMCNIYLPAIIR
jgi:hypothetical protein